MVVRGPSVGGVARLSEGFNYGGPWSVVRLSPGSPRPLIMVVRGPWSVCR
jgi:hypothetical protein